MKRSTALVGVALALTAVVLAPACGSSDTTEPGPPPHALLSISSIQGIGGPAWTPASSATCVEIGRDPKQTMVVNISAQIFTRPVAPDPNPPDFTLRPPGTCGSIRGCGTVVLRIDPNGDSEALRIDVAQSAIEAAFQKLGTGSHTFRVELRDADGNPVKAPDAGTAVFSEVTLTVTNPGECGGDAGSDAGVDAPGDAPADVASDATDAGSDASDASEDVTDANDASEDASDASDDTSDASDDTSDAASE